MEVGSIIVRSDYVKTLMDAGLTNLEARVFLTLIREKHATISKLCSAANIERANVYRTMKKLDKLGLLEKQIGINTVYQAIPLSDATSILVEQKKQEYNEIVNNLEKLSKELSLSEKKKFQENEDDFFKVLPSGSQVFCRKWEQTLKNIQKSVDLIVTEKREIKDDPIWDIYFDLLEKGVNVRWILDRSERNDQEFAMRVKQFQHLFKFPNIQMKVCYSCPKPYGVICDNKFVIILLDGKPPLKCSRSFWTNNNEILLNFKNHFESVWKKAERYIIKF